MDQPRKPLQFPPATYIAKLVEVDYPSGSFKLAGTLDGFIDFATPAGTWPLTVEEARKLATALHTVVGDLEKNCLYDRDALLIKSSESVARGEASQPSSEVRTPTAPTPEDAHVKWWNGLPQKKRDEYWPSVQLVNRAWKEGFRARGEASQPGPPATDWSNCPKTEDSAEAQPAPPQRERLHEAVAALQALDLESDYYIDGQRHAHVKAGVVKALATLEELFPIAKAQPTSPHSVPSVSNHPYSDQRCGFCGGAVQDGKCSSCGKEAQFAPPEDDPKLLAVRDEVLDLLDCLGGPEGEDKIQSPYQEVANIFNKHLGWTAEAPSAPQPTPPQNATEEEKKSC